MGNAGLMAFYAGDFSRGQESSIFSVSALTPKDWSKLTRHAGGGGSNAILDRIEESTSSCRATDTLENATCGTVLCCLLTS